VLKGAGFGPLHILALFTFAEIGAIDSLLVTLTVFLLTEALPAIASLEMPFLLITHCQNSEVSRLCRGTKQYFALLLDIDLIDFDVFVE
jgi:hypothetical protein